MSKTVSSPVSRSPSPLSQILKRYNAQSCEWFISPLVFVNNDYFRSRLTLYKYVLCLFIQQSWLT